MDEIVGVLSAKLELASSEIYRIMLDISGFGRWELLECKDPRGLDKILNGLFKR